jgi:hypothetical protein
MQQQQIPIQRWQRPLAELIPDRTPKSPAVKNINYKATDYQGAESQKVELQQAAPAQAKLPSSITLLRINSDFNAWLGSFDRTWVERGNDLVLVGVKQPVTKAPFRSELVSPAGAIKIATSRRYRSDSTPKTAVRLADNYGAVVWQEQIGAGQVIYVVTPYLAANAYQKQPGNFKFLAQLVTEPGHSIYVDEYLHGYKDPETLAKETSGSLTGYLAKTPLLLIAIQAAVLLLVLLWGQNRRLGPAQRLTEAAPDNSEAYIQALAGVLQKANCSDFVVTTIGKAEQIEIQRALGLGSTPLAVETVVDAWVQQTGRPASELQALFASKAQRFSDRDLQHWLEKLQIVRRQLE